MKKERIINKSNPKLTTKCMQITKNTEKYVMKCNALRTFLTHLVSFLLKTLVL